MEISGDSTRWEKCRFVTTATSLVLAIVYGLVSVVLWGCSQEPPPEPTDQEKGESALATKFADEKLHRSQLNQSKRTYVLFVGEPGLVVGRSTVNGSECSMHSGGLVEEIHAGEDGVTVLYTQTTFRTVAECSSGIRLLLSEERFNAIKSRHIEEVSTFGQVTDEVEEVPAEQ